jgi:predicted phage-related endonuclease
VLREKIKRLENIKHLLQLFQLQNKKIVLVLKMKMISKKKAFIKSFMSSWKPSQNDKKAQDNKGKHIDNDNREPEQNYSTSFKLLGLKPNRAKIGIPTT